MAKIVVFIPELPRECNMYSFDRIFRQNKNLLAAEISTFEEICSAARLAMFVPHRSAKDIWLDNRSWTHSLAAAHRSKVLHSLPATANADARKSFLQLGGARGGAQLFVIDWRDLIRDFTLIESSKHAKGAASIKMPVIPAKSCWHCFGFDVNGARRSTALMKWCGCETCCAVLYCSSECREKAAWYGFHSVVMLQLWIHTISLEISIHAISHIYIIMRFRFQKVMKKHTTVPKMHL